MTKTLKTFKLSESTLRQLDQLAQEYNRNRTQMLEELIAAAHAARFGPPLPEPVDGAALVEHMLKGKGE